MTEQPVTSPPADAPAPPASPRRRAAEPKAPRRTASWRPDPRWAHPWEFAATCWVTSFLVPLGVPAPVVALLGLAAGAIGATRARAAFPQVDFGGALPRQLAALSLLAGAVACGWLWHAWTLGPATAAAWLALLALALGAVYAVLRSSAPKWSQHVEEAKATRSAEHARTVWDRILADVGLKLRVVDVRETRAGLAVGVSPSGDHVVTFDTLRGRITELTTRASMLLAAEGVTVRSGDITPEETEAGHVFVLHVRTNHVLEQDIPFEPLGHPATAQDPVDTALYEDGAEVELSLVGDTGGTHGFVIGATGSGKTTSTQPIVGRYAETVDVVQGVIATDKLVPFVWPFLRPWVAGRADRPGIDFVGGQDPRHVMEMLAAVYLLARDRNTRLPDSGKHRCTPEEPGIVLWIEETADAIDHCQRIEVGGRNMSFSQLIDGLTRAGRSAQVAVVMLNQFALVDAFGDRGSEIFRNVTLRIVLRTMTSYDGSAMLPGLHGQRADAAKLRHNSMLVQPSIDEPRVMPAKGYLFAEGQIGDLVEAVAPHRPTIGGAEAAVMGPAWAQRWDADRCAELVRRAEGEGLTWPGTAAVDVEDRVNDQEDEMDREIRRFLDGQQPPVEQAPPPETTPETTHDGEQRGLPSADDAVAEMEAISARAGRVTLPEPLDSVMRLLEERGAPTGFVSSQQLAVRLGRVSRDADDEALTAAAAQLGREMARVDKELRTTQPTQPDGSRQRGYDVATLRQVAARIARGGR